ncbi:hypothetical protein T484DRAFT_1911786, partial [Baffinella frigidus]
MTLQDWTVVDRPSTQRPSTQGGARVFRDSRQDPPGERQFAPITPQSPQRMPKTSAHPRLGEQPNPPQGELGEERASWGARVAA